MDNIATTFMLMASILLWTAFMLGAVVWFVASNIGKKAVANNPEIVTHGIYVLRTKKDSPWKDEFDFVAVDDTKDGWVRYRFTKNPSESDRAHSTKADFFNYLYEPYKE